MGLAPQLRSTVVAAATVAGAAALAGPAGAALPGKYEKTLAGQGSLTGSWVISFARDRTYATILRGGVVVQGAWTPTTVKVGKGARARRVAAVELGPEEGRLACPGKGLYRWKRQGASMTFTKVRDACAARRRVLAETGPWSVVGG
ncbi:MAG: hypothetical protein R3C15_14780 [Thermoleophilia bacterium]